MNIISIISKPFHSKAVKLTLFACSILYSSIFIFMGLDFTDTPFWLNLYRNYSLGEISMVPATFFVGSVIYKLFGGELIVYRIIGLILKISSILIPYFALVPRKDHLRYLHWVSFTIIIACNDCILFDPDSFTIFVMSIIATCLISYSRKRNFFSLIIVSILSAFSVYVRFPNIISFPIIIMLIILIERCKDDSTYSKNTWWKASLYYILAYILSFVFFYWIFGLYEFNNVSNQLTTDGDSHSLSNMIDKILSDSHTLLCLIAFVVLFFHTHKVYERLKSRFFKVVLYSSVLLLFAIFLYDYTYGSPYNWNLNLLFSAIVICTMIYVGWPDSSMVIPMLIIFCLASVIPIGSDTGLLKLKFLLICFLPFIVSLLNGQQRLFKFYLPFICFLFLYSTYMYSKTYEDHRFHKTTSSIKEVPLLNGIHTTTGRSEFIRDVVADYNLCKQDYQSVVFMGNMAHIFYYITQEKALWDYPFYITPDDKKVLSDLMSIIDKDNPTIIWTPEYPDTFKITTSFGDEFTTFMESNGYTKINKGKYIVYSSN